MNFYHDDDIPDDLKRYFKPAPQIGLEASPEEHVAKLVEVFREVRRVLRSDGVLWLNYGDAYFGGGRGGNPEDSDFRKQATNAGSLVKAPRWGSVKGDLKPKDLIGLPWMLAFALRADGWWLRSDCIWNKPNPMPESVTDRPTRAHEYLFLLSKSARYFYDAEAIAEEANPANHRPSSGIRSTPPGSRPHGGPANGARSYTSRNARTVWTINPQPTPEAHFATFPEALAERCIKAGTSAKGACAKCGAPWERVTGPAQRVEGRASGNTERKIGSDHIPGASHVGRGFPWHPTTKPTVGWAPVCACHADVRPCLVLDPFAGSGTTLLVAERLGRDSVGIELNPEYIAIAERRIKAHDPTATIELAPGVKQASLFTGDMP